MIRLNATGWAGWTLGPYGKAREWRLFDPNGTNYTAREVAALRAMALDLDFLKTHTRHLESKVDQAATYLSADDVATLRGRGRDRPGLLCAVPV